MHKLLLCCFLLAICPPFLYCKLFCCQDGGIVLRRHNYFNRHNLNRHFGAKRRSQHFAMTATYQIITLYNSAVSPPSANLKPFQRRNLKRLTAAGGIYSGFQPQAEFGVAHRRKKSGHRKHRDRHILNYRFLCYLPFRHPKPISNLSKGGIVSGDPPQKSGHSISP